MSKKIINFAVVILTAITIIGLSSCKDEEVRYSCNPAIDAVIRQNLPRYENMTRKDWKNLPDSLKLAVFVAMKPEIKMEFWQGKYNEMMNAKFFKDSEKEHISKIYKYLLSIDDLYTDKYAQDFERKQRVFDYYKEWAIYGIDSLGWGVIDAILITEDMEELTEDYIEHVKQNAAPYTHLEHAGDSKEADCDCKYLLGCGLSYSCSGTECKGTKTGCGVIIRNEPCTKKCDYPTLDKNGNGVSAVDAGMMKYFDMSQRELLDVMFEEMNEALKKEREEAIKPKAEDVKKETIKR